MGRVKSIGILLAVLFMGCDKEKPASAPTAAPATSKSPPASITSQSAPTLDSFKAHVEKIPSVWSRVVKAGTANITSVDVRIVETDLKRTDSAVNPVMGYAVFSETVASEGSWYYSKQYTIWFAPLADGTWKAVKAEEKNTGSSSSEIKEGASKALAVQWIAARLGEPAAK